MKSVPGAVATGLHLTTIKLTESCPVATALGTDLVRTRRMMRRSVTVSQRLTAMCGAKGA